MKNQSAKSILISIFMASLGLFINGFGVYLTIHADIGVAPWDVLNMGISNTFGILYGNASIAVSLLILLIDILMRESIGIALFLDSVIVGKTVDLFNRLNLVPVPKTLWGGAIMTVIGLLIQGYTLVLYMGAALGCGPRDTLLVGLKKRAGKLPIGLVSILMLSTATLIGYLLGGPVGPGTLLCAFAAGPIMQFDFFTVRFDPTNIKHQRLHESLKVLFGKYSFKK